MDTPFVFGRLAVGENFTDRKEELQHLKRNFLSGINTILISPRRWGKSSLVKKAADEIIEQHEQIRIVFLDMFNIRTEEDFYKTLSEKTIQAVSGKFEELIGNSKKFLKQWVPRISFSPDAVQEISFGLDWSEVKERPDEILHLPEAIAKEKKLRLIICIDEFQNIGFFKDPTAFQKKLRSHWQRHQQTSYCLYGSKLHMMTGVFASPSMPFYKFGDLMFINKISGKYWKIFIQSRFNATGKMITPEQSARIALSVDNHPYYVQQLAQLCWLRSGKKIKGSIIDEALESLVLQLSLLFQNMTETLTTAQINFLKALIDGVEKITSKKTIDMYHLNSSANIIRIREALIRKEIIDVQITGKPEILDPVYKIWLRDFYFRDHSHHS